MQAFGVSSGPALCLRLPSSLPYRCCYLDRWVSPSFNFPLNIIYFVSFYIEI